MAVTEIALLQHKAPPSTTTTTSSTPPVFNVAIQNLTCGAQEQASFSHYPVALLRCHEDPSLIYLVGGWESVDQHMKEWIPGKTNRNLLELLGKDLDVKWMFHFDAEPAHIVDRLVKGTQGRGEDCQNGVVAIGRHFAKDGQRDDFAKAFNENVDALEDFLGGRSKREGGWRVDRGFVADAASDPDSDGIRDEFVLLSTWASVERHMEFAKTEAFQKYSMFEDYLEGAEIRHGQVFYIAGS